MTSVHLLCFELDVAAAREIRNQKTRDLRTLHTSPASEMFLLRKTSRVPDEISIMSQTMPRIFKIQQSAMKSQRSQYELNISHQMT